MKKTGDNSGLKSRLGPLPDAAFENDALPSIENKKPPYSPKTLAAIKSGVASAVAKARAKKRSAQ